MKLTTLLVICAIAAVIAPAFGETACSNATADGDECSGLASSLADAQGGGLALAALLVGGAFVANRQEGEKSRAAALRPCPRCGRGVPVGVLDCPSCEFDFRTIGRQPPPPPPE